MFTKGHKINLGKKHSKKTKEQMSESAKRIGTGKWNIGRNPSKKERLNISKSKLGDKNPKWKGDAVGYNALHTWIRTNLLKPKYCKICNKKPPMDVSNISGKYKRDLADFEWLCRKCHMIKDKTITNLKQYHNGDK